MQPIGGPLITKKPLMLVLAYVLEKNIRVEYFMKDTEGPFFTQLLFWGDSGISQKLHYANI